MHKPILGFDYAYKAHACVHHTLFKSDRTYHLQKEKDKHKIPMAWWNGPLLIAAGSIVPALIIWISGLPWFLLVQFIILCAAYYGAYERLHWCMHLPKNRLTERNPIFFRLNGHHLLHHRYMNKNYNVVLPFADLLYGTLLSRSPINFNQARGPAVPDVQPKMA